MHCRSDFSGALNLLCPGPRRRPEYRSTAEHMLHLCKDKDYAVPALASAYTLAVSQAAKRFRVRAPDPPRPAHLAGPWISEPPGTGRTAVCLIH